MVGEIRDSETAEIAIRAALTGTRFSARCTPTIPTGAVTRLIDMGVEAFLISSSLEGVLAQRLVRRICPQLPRGSAGDPAMRDQLAALGRRKVEGVVLSRQRMRRMPRHGLSRARRHF